MSNGKVVTVKLPAKSAVLVEGVACGLGKTRNRYLRELIEEDLRKRGAVVPRAGDNAERKLPAHETR